MPCRMFEATQNFHPKKKEKSNRLHIESAEHLDVQDNQ